MQCFEKEPHFSVSTCILLFPYLLVQISSDSVYECLMLLIRELSFHLNVFSNPMYFKINICDNFRTFSLYDPLDCSSARLLCLWDCPGSKYWGGLLCPLPGSPDPEIASSSLTSPALVDRFFTIGTSWEARWFVTFFVTDTVFHVLAIPVFLGELIESMVNTFY